MENDLQVNYDALCYATFLNIKHLTDGADYIIFKNVDWNNKEHKFVVIHLPFKQKCISVIRTVESDGRVVLYTH